MAVDRARAQNMPKENIERAIKRATGADKDANAFEEVYYDGYGPHGVAMMIQCVTENRNRTVAEIRHILTRSGGNMGEAGSVGWQFTRNSYFAIPAKGADYEKIFELAVEGGANDVRSEDEWIEIIGPVEAFKSITDQLRSAGITPEEAELRMIPNQEMELNVDQTTQVLRTIEALEELDDVQNVYHTMKISEEALMALEE